MSTPSTDPPASLKSVELLSEGIYSFIKRGKFVWNEVNQDEGPAVLAAREFSALLDSVCAKVDGLFLAKGQHMATCPYQDSVREVCKSLKAELHTVTTTVLASWRRAAQVSLLEVLFTDEGFNRAGGDVGLATLCKQEQSILEKAIRTFHDQWKVLCEKVPEAEQVLLELHYDLNKPPIPDEI